MVAINGLMNVRGGPGTNGQACSGWGRLWTADGVGIFCLGYAALSDSSTCRGDRRTHPGGWSQ